MTGEIKVKKANENRVKINFSYNPDYIKKIKTINGYKWHPEEKYWSIPLNNDIFNKLESLFGSEKLDIESSLQIHSSKTKKTFKFLPLTIRIDTYGGIATPIILRGTPLPAQRSKFFSTSVDNQESVDINILMGESPIGKNNLKIQTLSLTKIPKAPRGDPQIIVTFEVDEFCNVTSSAVEKSSGRKVTVKFNDAQHHLNDQEIKHLLQQAETTRKRDENLLKLIEAKNKAYSVIDKAEDILRKHQDKNIFTDDDKNIEKVLATLGIALDIDNAENIRSNVEVLNTLITLVTPGNMDDMFSAFIGFPHTVHKSPTKKINDSQITNENKQSVGNHKLRDKLATSSKTVEHIGRIFGGGEFTLDSNLCFVLMPFEEKMRPIYDGHICKIIESERLNCLRADEIVGTNLITWDVWEKINRARFLIADLTGKNANVFYEVGLAHALGKEVILLTQTMDDVPFDLKALRCIVYSYTPKGMKDMEIKLKETIIELIKSS